MPVLMGWRDYFALLNAESDSKKEHQYVDPMSALAVLRKRYGGK